MTPTRPQGADAIPMPRTTPDRGRAPVEPSQPPSPGSAQLYAALDLGTNSCRMLIAQPKGSQFLVIDSFSKTVQLGAGLEASGKLSRASMNRTIQALRICEKKIEKHGVGRMRLVATEACRRASNSKEFIKQVRRETGLTIEIIGSEEEARLAVISCAPLVRAASEQLLIVDIGGGTSDVSLVRVSPTRAKAADRAADVLGNGGIRLGGTDFDRSLSLAEVMPHLGHGSTLSQGKTLLPNHYFLDLATWHRINSLYAPRKLVEIKGLMADADRPDLVGRLVQVTETRAGHALGRHKTGRLPLGLGWQTIHQAPRRLEHQCR